MFALFASRLHYTKDDFYSLTLNEANAIMDAWVEHQTQSDFFTANQVRLICYYVTKFSLGAPKNLNDHKNLYTLGYEVNEIEERRKRIEKDGVQISELDKEMLTRHGFNIENQFQ